MEIYLTKPGPEENKFDLELTEYDNGLLDMVVVSGLDSKKLYSAIEWLRETFELDPLSNFEQLDSGRFIQGFAIPKHQTQNFKQYMFSGHTGTAN